MVISTRTPEGFPSECPLCGTNTNIEFSDPASDAPCPVCGCLIWKSSEIFDSIVQTCGEQLGVDPELITVDSRFVQDLGADSLDIIELVMECEEEFNVDMGNVSEDLLTIGDTVRYIQSDRQH